MAFTNYCFCELAPLYAIGLLNESEREWVEQQIEETPELAEELAQYQAAVTTLPYSLPPVALDNGLKGRLFNRLGLTLPQEEAPLAKEHSEKNNPFLTVRFQDIEWQAHSVPGVEISVFYTDTEARRISGILKAAAGMRYPLHRHAEVEEIYMMSGDLIIGDEVYGAGDYIRSHPSSVHAPHTRDGCMFFFNTSMDDEYFEKSVTAF
jgi:anti-sigma factor ChrR (cupin superfamily)